MQRKLGYPSFATYQSHFKTWNNALIAANLPLNQYQDHWQDGTEVCSYCGRKADEIEGFKQWLYDKKGNRFCFNHGRGQDYIKGELDINSTKGQGRAGEILVAKTLKIANEFDCNRISCGYKFDLYHDEYKKIDVKTALFSCIDNRWTFNFNKKQDANTYICVGLSSDRKEVEHVWVVPNVGNIKDLQTFTVYDTQRSLFKREYLEINSKPYDDTWKSMKLDNCKIMIDKSKMETEEEKEKHEVFKKAYFKKLGITE